MENPALLLFVCRTSKRAECGVRTNEEGKTILRSWENMETLQACAEGTVMHPNELLRMCYATHCAQILGAACISPTAFRHPDTPDKIGGVQSTDFHLR